jgi:hypothetical protein
MPSLKVNPILPDSVSQRDNVSGDLLIFFLHQDASSNNDCSGQSFLGKGHMAEDEVRWVVRHKVSAAVPGLVVEVEVHE